MRVNTGGVGGVVAFSDGDIGVFFSKRFVWLVYSGVTDQISVHTKFLPFFANKRSETNEMPPCKLGNTLDGLLKSINIFRLYIPKNYYIQTYIRKHCIQV